MLFHPIASVLISIALASTVAADAAVAQSDDTARQPRPIQYIMPIQEN